jgi:membrane fusion protein YbhG
MNRRRIAVIAIIVVAIGALAAWLIARRSSPDARTLSASGTVEAREADLGFQYPGRIASIDVHEGDAVAAGQLLAALDTAELTARLLGARAQLAAAQAQLAEMVRGSRPEEVAQARAADAAAGQRLDDARRDLDRTRTLQQGGAVSQEALDKATTAFAVAQSQYDQAHQQLRLVQAGPRRERIEAQRAMVRSADAAVSQLQASLANAVVRAPFPGVVTIRHREPGEIVPAGAPVLTLMNPGDRWVRIYVPEDRVDRVKLGEPATITADAFPGRTYGGRVSFISSEAEFTPKNVQTAEERVKLVYAVKVAITGDRAGDLKPGVPADVVLQPAAGGAPAGRTGDVP